MEIRKLYFDMDGVLTDFDGGVEQLCGLKRGKQEFMSEEQDDLMWSAIRQVPHFFAKLEPMPGAEELFRVAREKLGDRVEILTGVPKERRGILTAAEDKKQWIREHLSRETVVNTVYKAQKPDFCTGIGDILIDDLPATIRTWQERGGTGILHVSAEDTLRQLLELIG